MHPTDLETGFRTDPLDVPAEDLVFSWRCDRGGQLPMQTAYRILVASTPSKLAAKTGDIWDSGRIESAASTAVQYDGPPLRNETTYYWCVKVWGSDGAESDFSDPAPFRTAVGPTSEWDGQWIAHQPEHGDTNGFRTPWREAETDANEWVQLDFGAQYSIGQMVVHPCAVFTRLQTPDGMPVSEIHSEEDDEYTDGVCGFGFPVRYRIEVADDPDFETATTVVDRTDERQSNPITDPVTVAVDAVGQYLRLTAVELYTFDPRDPPHWRFSEHRAELDRAEHDPYRIFSLGGITVEAENGDVISTDAACTASASVESESWSVEYIAADPADTAPVSSSPRFRSTVAISGPVEAAHLHIAGLGYNECYLNGEKVGDAVLDPAWTDYESRVLYHTYEVSEYLTEGHNAIGVWLGRGRFSKSTRTWMGFGSPRALVRLTIEYEDGTTKVLSSDASLAQASPITANDIYDGETYDARRAEPGWNTAGFDAATWDHATEVPGPGGALRPQQIEPMEQVEEIEPVSIDAVNDGYRIDFGQNLTGWVEIAVGDVAPGETIEISHAEAVQEDGTLSTVDLRTADATDRFVGGETAQEWYEPRFTYHGFRYAKVEHYPRTLTATDITAKVVHTAMDDIGQFDCSDDVLGQLQHNAKWGLRGNAHGIPEDCPQRDERFGWTGDAQISSRAMLLNFDANRFFVKWLRDHSDDQSPHGYQSDTIPFAIGARPADPTWSQTRVVIPWRLYQIAGNTQLLEQQYQEMRNYVEYWDSNVEDGVLPGSCGRYGDWLAFENTDGNMGKPRELFTTAYHCRTLDRMGDIARAIGQAADADRYRNRFETMREQFNDRFFDEEAGRYRPETQAAQAVPLHFGLVPVDQTRSVLDTLVEYVEAADYAPRLGSSGRGRSSRPSSITAVAMWPTRSSDSQPSRAGPTWSSKVRPRSGSTGTATTRSATA